MLNRKTKPKIAVIGKQYVAAGYHEPLGLWNNMISKELLTFCKEFNNWPESWEIDTPDIQTGKMILYDVFIPFFEHLVSSGLSKKTINMHINNIWLLGGEIISRVNFDEEFRNETGLSLVEMNIGEHGGPYSKHLHTAAAEKSFNSSCKKLYKFINGKNKA